MSKQRLVSELDQPHQTPFILKRRLCVKTEIGFELDQPHRHCLQVSLPAELLLEELAPIVQSAATSVREVKKQRR